MGSSAGCSRLCSPSAPFHCRGLGSCAVDDMGDRSPPLPLLFLTSLYPSLLPCVRCCSLFTVPVRHQRCIVGGHASLARAFFDFLQWTCSAPLLPFRPALLACRRCGLAFRRRLVPTTFLALFSRFLLSSMGAHRCASLSLCTPACAWAAVWTAEQLCSDG